MLRLRRRGNVRAPEAAVAVQGVRGQLRVRARAGAAHVSGLRLRARGGEAQLPALQVESRSKEIT
jgi:hypothetical protein